MTSQTTPVDQYLQPLIHHKKLMIGVAIGTLLLGLLGGLMAESSYSSKASIHLNPISGDPTDLIDSSKSGIDMATELRLVSSENVITRAGNLLADQSVTVTARELRDGLTATSTKDDSRIVDVSFTSNDAEKAQQAANAFAESYLDYRSELAANNKTKAEEILKLRLDEVNAELNEVTTQLLRAREGSAEEIQLTRQQTSLETTELALTDALVDLSTLTNDPGVIITNADLPRAPEGLSLMQILFGALVAGTGLGAVAAFLAHSLCHTTSDEDDDYGADGIDRDASNSRLAAITPGFDEAMPVIGELPVEDNKDIKVSGVLPAAESSHVEPPSVDVPPEPAPQPTILDTGSKSSMASGPTTMPKTRADRPPATEEAGRERRAETDILSDLSPQERERADAIGGLVTQGDYRSLLNKLRKLGTGRPVIGVCIGERSRDASLAIGFGVADALQALGARVLLVDMILDEPILDTLVGLPLEPGLADVVHQRATLNDVVRTLEGLERLGAVTAGRAEAETRRLLSGAPFIAALQEAATQFHAIILVAGSASDALRNGPVVGLGDGIVVGVEQPPGASPEDELIHQLSNLSAPILELISIDAAFANVAETASASSG